MVQKILFVDDDPNMQKMVELFMRKSKHQLSSAINGRSALKILEKNSFDFRSSAFGFSGIWSARTC